MNKIEFLGYYSPAVDESDQVDLNNNISLKSLQSLRYLSICNNNNKLEQINLNIGQFKKDLTLLLSNAKVSFLELIRLQDIDDEYFQCLFTTKASSQGSYLHESIETLNLVQMNNFSPFLIESNFLNTKNSLKSLNLFDCKRVTKMDSARMKRIISFNKLDCQLQWS